jgi:hypothetical protein
MPGVHIQDGGGSGHLAHVTKAGQLEVSARSVTAEHFANEMMGRAFHIPFEQSPTAGDDAIFYMENTGASDILIEGITIAVDQACEVYFKINDRGTRNGATAIVPVNVNSQSGLDLDAIVEQGVDLDGGAATLTGGAEFDRLKFFAARNSAHFNFEADVLLATGGAMTIWCDAAAATVLATIVCYANGDLA